MSEQRLRVAELPAAIPSDGGTHRDESRVQEYMRLLDHLEPVVVFRTPEGPLLADGYHRLAAAQRVGAETIEADVRTGTKADALRYAIKIDAAHRGMSPEEVRAHVLRRFGGKEVIEPMRAGPSTRGGANPGAMVEGSRTRPLTEVRLCERLLFARRPR